MRIKFFADKNNIDWYLIPTIAFDYNHWIGSHKSFMISLRWWKWNAGFTIFWHHNLMQNESTDIMN